MFDALNRTRTTFVALAAVGMTLSLSAAAADQRTEICGALFVSKQPFAGDLCLFAGSPEDGTPVKTRSCPPPSTSPDLGFLWHAKRTVDGAWLITSLRSTQERRIEVQHAGKENGSRIIIWGPAAALFDKQQIWSFLPVGDGGFKILGLDSHKCLNVPLGRRPLNQEELQLYDCQDTPNNTWTIRPVVNQCR